MICYVVVDETSSVKEKVDRQYNIQDKTGKDSQGD